MSADSYANSKKASIENWRNSTWGEEISLEYGKGLRGYQNASGQYRVFGSNGPVGWTEKPLAEGPGVILGRKGAYRGVQYSPDPFFVIDTAYYVVPKKPLDMRWLYYAIQYYKLGEIDDGSPVPSTTRAAVYVRDLQVPPLDVQKSISDVLGSLDDKISLNQEISKTLEQVAHAIFKSWFIDFDPVRIKMAGRQPEGMDVATAALFPSEVVESELGLIPKGWVVKSLDSIAEYLNGLAMQRFPVKGEDDSLPVIKIAQLKKGNCVGADRASSDIGSAYVVEDGDVLFSWSGSLEVDIWCGGRGALNQHLFKVTSSVYPKWFYYLWTQYHLEHFQSIAAGKAVTMGHIQRKHLTEAKCLVPDVRLLDRFHVLSDLIEQHISLRLQARSLADIRDVLLPELFLGSLSMNKVSLND